MAGEDKSVGNDNVLPSAGNKDNNLGDVIGGKGLAATNQIRISSETGNKPRHKL